MSDHVLSFAVRMLTNTMGVRAKMAAAASLLCLPHVRALEKSRVARPEGLCFEEGPCHRHVERLGKTAGTAEKRGGIARAKDVSDEHRPVNDDGPTGRA